MTVNGDHLMLKWSADNWDMQLKVPARHSVLLVYYMLPPVYTGALAHNNAYFGEGSGPIFIGRTQCSGSESSIAQCTYNTVTQCSHSDDAGVTCSGETCNTQ